MNMMHTHQFKQPQTQLMGEALVVVEAQPSEPNATVDFLDSRFPLQRGSHNQVKSYVVYYQHLLAFFADGSHCGLQIPSQFVALSGHREKPTALLLKAGDTHVELVLDKAGRMHACTGNGSCFTAKDGGVYSF